MVVDFIKYDDIVPFPDEVKAVANAIAQCGPIVLSLSPGRNVDPNHLEAFNKGQMLRVSLMFVGTHSHYHSPEVRYQPDYPHHQTVSMESFPGIFAPPSDNISRPCCMYEH